MRLTRTREELRPKIELMKKGAEEKGVGLRQRDLVASLLVALGNDENEAMRTFAPFIVSILRHLSPHQLKTAGIAQEEIPEIVRRYREKGWEDLPSKVYDLGVIGVEGCIDAFGQVRDAGFIHAKFGGTLGPDKELAIEIFVEKVMPHFSSD